MVALQVVGGDDSDKLIVFFKIRPDVITPDNLHSCVFVSSMIDSPVNSLYHAVQKVNKESCVFCVSQSSHTKSGFYDALVMFSGFCASAAERRQMESKF